jgi:hypothetical protein
LTKRTPKEHTLEKSLETNRAPNNKNNRRTRKKEKKKKKKKKIKTRAHPLCHHKCLLVSKKETVAPEQEKKFGVVFRGVVVFSMSLASKRGRDWLEGSDKEEEDEEAVELTASHPWGVLPWGNFEEGGAPSARASLGALSALDDAALLSVLGQLDARALCRLARCCRALAVFAAHEPLWRELLLRAAPRDWRWRGSFRNSLVTRLGGPLASPFPVPGLFSDLLNKSWLCATARFNRSWIGPDTVPRERADDLSVQEFVRKYERPNKPVLISGLVKKWPL